MLDKTKINFKPTIPPEEYFNKAPKDDNKPIKEKSKSVKGHNILLGSLIALASISIPAINMLKNDNKSYNLNTVYLAQKDELVCNPAALAKGGGNDSIVELKELMNILDLSSLEGLPQSSKSAILTVAMANLNPVIVGKNVQAAEKSVREQIKNVQTWIDKSAYEYKINPPKSPDEILNDYKHKYVTGDEILDRVDFSELTKYQKDITVLKALLRGSMNRISRDDLDSETKIREEVKNAQDFVDSQVKQYKIYSHVAGNSDYNDNLSKYEFINLLDTKSLEGIEAEKQQEILNNAVKEYKPVSFNKIKDNNAVNKTNKKILELLQQAQDKLDSEAAKASINSTYKAGL